MLNNMRIASIIEEIKEVETMAELKAIWCDWNVDAMDAVHYPGFTVYIQAKVKEMKSLPKPEAKPQLSGEDAKAVLQNLLKELAELKATKQMEAVSPVVRASRRYRIVKFEVPWTSKPQVLGIMHILAAHVKPGDVIDESEIVKMMVANESVLNTKQGGKRIWDYYKGTHAEGLLAHGNIERA